MLLLVSLLSSSKYALLVSLYLSCQPILHYLDKHSFCDHWEKTYANTKEFVNITPFKSDIDYLMNFTSPWCVWNSRRWERWLIRFYIISWKIKKNLASSVFLHILSSVMLYAIAYEHEMTLTQNIINIPWNNYWIDSCLFLGSMNEHYFLREKTSIFSETYLILVIILSDMPSLAWSSVWFVCLTLNQWQAKHLTFSFSTAINNFGVTFFSSTWIFFLLIVFM